MAETWVNCPLFVRYRETKRAYMKELRLEKWRKEQRIELWNAIRITFSDISDPKKEYWMRRLYSYYCNRFYRLVKLDWLIFLGELNDKAAYGEYKQEKAKEYCCMVRDTAWWMTHASEENTAEICEPVTDFIYFELAA